jgi:hypothetical protein
MRNFGLGIVMVFCSGLLMSIVIALVVINT